MVGEKKIEQSFSNEKLDRRRCTGVVFAALVKLSKKKNDLKIQVFVNDVNVGFNKERRNLRYRFIPQFMRSSIHGIPGCLSCNFSFTQNFISSRPFVLCIISWKRGLDRSLLRFLRFPRQSPSSSLLNYIHTE